MLYTYKSCSLNYRVEFIYLFVGIQRMIRSADQPLTDNREFTVQGK